MVRFGAASSAARVHVLQLLTQHLLIAPLDTAEQLAVAAGMPNDLADLAVISSSGGELHVVVEKLEVLSLVLFM